MGVFVLNSSNNGEINIDSLKDIGRKKGLEHYIKHKIGNYDLHLLRNELKKDNYYLENEFAIYSFGSFIYKKRTSKDALKLYLSDYKKSRIDEEHIYGSFILILKHNDVISIKRDQSQISKIFKVSGESLYSNSFLSLIFPINKKITFNKQSIKENVLLGFILGPKTIINEIREVDSDTDDNDISFFNFSKKQYKENEIESTNGLDQRIINLLEDQYYSIASAFSNGKVDIGLSGGYDSRLNFEIAKRYFDVKSHSHYKERKDNDLDIAREICYRSGINLKTKKIRPAVGIRNENDLLKLIDDSFFYYDGRVAVNTGFFNEIYTRKYREFILDGTELTLTGFGGEIFRNHDFQPGGKLYINHWLENFVFSYYKFNAIIKTKENKSFLEDVKKNILLKLGISDKKRISFEDRRKYFNDVWLPMTYSIKSFSENQLSYFISPFINDKIFQLSQQLSVTLSKDWNFQAKLIDEIDPKLSDIKSSYGYSFNQKPLIYGLKNKFKNLKIILTLKNNFQKYSFKKKLDGNHFETDRILDDIFKEVLEYIEDVDIKYIRSSINWYYNVLSIALIIKRIKEHNESI